MRVPLSWLAEYVPLRMPPAELAHRLTMAGLETTYDPGPGGGWGNVVVGSVVDVRPHPNADRLRLADVDTGGGTATVVCGAPNVAAGQKIAFARVGAVLTSGKTGEPVELTAAVIRGVESAGMVCSERELG
ncbi:MAG: phenylalanine--tRNA ligase subunit beta, partial [Chloroflexi bacterium]|nr:phenylalanine--tRNA ligase subunit beta [Chloroflexota bacterium]